MVKFLNSNSPLKYPIFSLVEMPLFRVISKVKIPLKQLTQLTFSCIILGYKGRVDTPEFKQSIIRLLSRKLIMYEFNVKGDMGRHFLSISGASAECGISTSTINRSAGKTFPPKRKLSEGRVGFWVFQIVEWLQGKRGGWK